MKTQRFIWAGLIAISLCLYACGGIEEPSEPSTPTPEVIKSEITIDASIISNGLSFTSNAGDQSITFTTHESWTLTIASTTSGETWCTASSSSGAKGTANVRFTVKENTSYDDRSVSVTIKSGTASKTFKLSQKCANALLLTTNKYEISQNGGTIDIEVKANIDYKMEISENAKTWITESSTKALSSYKHKLNVAASEEVEKREGEIYFMAGDKTDTVKVYQAGAGALILLSSNEYYVSSTGETITVDLRCNCDYEVVMPNVNWIQKEPESRAMSSHTLRYVIIPNPTYDSREATIIFKEKNGPIADTLLVSQAQLDAIILSKKEIEINFTGGTVEVKLETNTDYNVIMPEVEWISENNTRALTEYKKTFYISNNESAESRSCNIIFQSTSKSVTDTLTINQKGKSNYLFFEKDIAYWSPNKSAEKIIIQSDMAYELSWVGGRPDWLDHWTKEQNGVSIQLKENTSVKNRCAQLVAHSRTLADTLMIVQDGVKGIELTHNNLEIDYIGDTVSFDIYANIEYKMIIPKVDWIKAEIIKQEDNAQEGSSTTYNSTTVRLIISALEASEGNRMEHIRFDDLNDEYPQYDKTLTIKQYKKIGNSYTMEELYRKQNNTKLEELCIMGNITREDFNYLRRLAGADTYYYSYGDEYTTKPPTNPGKLKKLDLSKATIIACEYSNTIANNRGAIQWQDENTLDLYHLSNTKLETIVLPDNLKKISWNTFEGCTDLKDIVFGGEVETILNGAFKGCSNLKRITFPAKTRFNFEGYAEIFTGCSELSDVTFLGDFYLTDETIENYVISYYNILFGDTKLTNLRINGNSRNIPPYAFYECNGLKGEFIFKGVKSLGENAFSYCENISKITFTEDATFTSIETLTFSFCKKLTSIELPASVRKIGSFAFAQCDSLETISVPKNVNYVDEEAFSSYYGGVTCEKLKAINCYPTNPPATKSTKYSEHTILYVPKGCLEAYEKSQWGLNFKIIKEME